MEPANQLRVGDHTPADDQPLTYHTDDDLDRRLSQIEQGLQHFQAILPAMAREVAIVRGQLRRAA